MKKNILFIGYGDELLNLIKTCKKDKNINIVGLILRTDLKQKVRKIFLKKIQKLGIKHLNVKKINSIESRKKLRLLDLDLICCLGFNELFNKNFIKVPKKGIINLHPGLLPKGRGSGAITGEILNNSKYLGYTSHLVNDKFDLGTIINQIRFKFSGLDKKKNSYILL
jgi:methionyl-tRNA formyltransferase